MNKSLPCIKAVDLGKEYRIPKASMKATTLADRLAQTCMKPLQGLKNIFTNGSFSGASNEEIIWAIRNISFEIMPGEVVGVIGGNGAGKSTLLKILSRITQPSEGYAELRGRVGSLLEVGTGFHPELTGRENIFLNGSILGMKRAEIIARFDEIVDFSGIQKFIDTPVKHYSSGMYVRLAFAVAAHLDPEILIVDEVLAVGDIHFQEKCLGKMSQVANSGRTVLLVSHNMTAISALCPRSLVVHNGKLNFFGSSQEAIEIYTNNCFRELQENLKLRRDRKGQGSVKVVKIHLEAENGDPIPSVPSGNHAKIVLEYENQPDSDVSEVEVSLIFAETLKNSHLFSCLSSVSTQTLTIDRERGRLVCEIDSLPLVPGHYYLHVTIMKKGLVLDKVMRAAQVIVTEGDFFGTGKLATNSEWYGNILVKHVWRSEEQRFTPPI